MLAPQEQSEDLMEYTSVFCFDLLPDNLYARMRCILRISEARTPTCVLVFFVFILFLFYCFFIPSTATAGLSFNPTKNIEALSLVISILLDCLFRLRFHLFTQVMFRVTVLYWNLSSFTLIRL